MKIARAATGRAGVIAFTGAYHGRTMMTLGLTGRSPVLRRHGPDAGRDLPCAVSLRDPWCQRR